MFDKPMFIRRMYDLRISALESQYYCVPCADELKPLINAFFERAENEIEKCQEDVFVAHRIEQIAECVKNLARNTRKFEAMYKTDMIAINKMFKEMEDLLEETLQVKPENRRSLWDKISCINGILEKNHCKAEETNCSNWRNGLLFNYDKLWKIIHQVNTEWENLKDKGFSLGRFYDYAISEFDARYKEKILMELLFD